MTDAVMESIDSQIERISGYEKIMDEAILILNDYSPAKSALLTEYVSKLESYYTSSAWKEDYEADEAGLLPQDLKRGVLSEDGISGVLDRAKELDIPLITQPGKAEDGRAVRRFTKELINRVIKSLAVLFAIVLAVSILANAIVIFSTKDSVKTYDEFDGHYDYIIVLGCGVIDNQYPSDRLADRLDTAIRLYENGAAPKILLSGDHRVDDYNELAVMRNYMIEHGVPDDVIFCDDLGLSTNETMERAVRLFDVSSAVIVTQKYHLYRSIYLARDYGIDCEGVCATGRTFTYHVYHYSREFMARIKDFFLCLVN